MFEFLPFTDSANTYMTNIKITGTDKARTVAIGEPVVIVLTLRNPLSNAIYVDDIQLYANLEESSEAEKPLSPKSLQRKRSNSKITLLEDDLAALEGDEEKEEEQNKNMFEVTPISLQFEPKSSRVVYLRIIPKVSGSFRIVGVRWKLRRGVEESSVSSSSSKVDAVFGRREFVLPGRPLNRTRKQRSSRARAPDMRLHFKVIESRPWLGVKLQQEESIQSMYQGEMKHLRFSIRNHGNAKITSLKVMCCNPVFSICCCTKKGFFAKCSDVLGRIVDVSIDKALNSPDTKCQDIDLWVRAETSGKHDLQILFNYEGPPHSASGSGEKDERWRSVEFSKCLEILPSLQIRSYVVHNFVSTKKYNVQVRIKNVCPRSIVLRDVMTISNVWNVKSRHGQNKKENSTLHPNHVVVFHGVMSRSSSSDDKRRASKFDLDTSTNVDDEKIEWLRSSMFRLEDEKDSKKNQDVATYFLLLDNAPRALSVVRDAMRRKQEALSMETQQKMWERNADDEQKEAELEAATLTPTRERINTPQSPLLEIPLWTEESVRPPLPIDNDALFVGGPEAGDELHVQVKWFVPVQGTQHLTRLQRS